MVTSSTKTDHGKHPAAPAKPPHGKEVHLNKPVQKRSIPDDDPEEPAAAKPKAAGTWVISMSVSKAVLLVFLSLLIVGAVVKGTLYYADTRATAALRSKIAQAIEAHAALHRHDGNSFHEMTLIDSIRGCLSATLLPLDFVLRNGLKDAGGEAIIAAAERHCLNTMITDVARNQIIAQEAVRQAIEPGDKEREVTKLDEQLHFIITFAKMKGYALPDDFKNFKTDISILNRFMDAPQPAEDQAAAPWHR